MIDELARLIERPEWMRDAACRGMDPELFYPSRGESVAQARKVCSGCPVRAECLTYAMNLHETHGMWGGMSERDRRRIRRGELTPRRPVGHPVMNASAS